MKCFLLALVLLLPLSAITCIEEYHYEFSFAEVKTDADAKIIEPFLSAIFDTRPVFSDDTDYFICDSPIKIDEQLFRAKLKKNGYRVLDFQLTFDTQKTE